MREPSRRSRVLGLALALLALPSCAPGDGPRRIVLITLDTLRADGLAPETMPRTWAFAGRGQRFERAYAAASTTQPTHATLFTGLHPWQHGVSRNGVALPPDHDTLAERLRAAGFETAAVVASFPLERRFGFDQGFDHYEQEFRHPLVIDRWKGQAVEGNRFYGLSGAVVERALARLDALEGTRQFLWVHFFDPHEPYGDAARGPLLRLGEIRRLARHGRLEREHLERARARYDADLRRLDRALGRLFARLERSAGEVETHVVLTSDHGESFGEDGSFAHGYRVSPEQVHVPLVIVSPGVEAGIRRDVAGSRDVGRTVLGLARADASGFPGRDLLGDREAPEARAFGMSGRWGAVPELRVDGSRVARASPRYFRAGGAGLLAGDGERVTPDDRAGPGLSSPEVAALQQLFAGFDTERGQREGALLGDATTTEALRALGYAD